MRTRLIIAFSVCVISLAACAQQDMKTTSTKGRQTSASPDSPGFERFRQQLREGFYLSLVKESLELAGDNKNEIESFLADTPPEQREAAEFLVAYMPPSDLACATSEALKTHLEYAFKTRDLLPWSKKVTEKLFLHYVLPHRVSQEPFEQWREYLFERIYPRVKHLETMEEVALEINRWCAERFTYKYTQARDQGAFENLKRGFGRCEEMMILYICAARSVGIPTRACATPLWSTCNDNHAWVEVWCDGKWYYLGACEVRDALNKAWFELPAQRAPLVTSRIYGVPEQTEGLYRVEKQSAIINSTSVYSQTGMVKMDIPKGEEVYFYVFNYGSLRPFSKREGDENGKVQVEFGPGEYLFTVTSEKKVSRWGKVRVEAGKDAEVEYAEGATPEGYMWLHYPGKPKPKAGAKAARERKPLPEYKAPPDTYKVREFKPEDYPEVMKIIEGHELKDKVVEALKKSLGNCDNIARAIARCDSDDIDVMMYLITELEPLELIEATPEILMDHLTYAKAARALWKNPPDDKLWKEFILKPRISYEPLRAWREKLFLRFGEMVIPAMAIYEKRKGEDPAATALAINKWLAQNVKKIERGYFGNTKTPLDVVVSRCGTEGEITCCAVGILRAVGIPARLSKNRKWAEFHDGKEWHPLYPLEPEHFKSTEKTAEVASEYEKPGTLALKFMRKGLPMAGLEHFAAIKLGGEYWAAAWPDKKTDENGAVQMELTPGEYLFNAGVRNKNGDPYIFFKRLKIESGKETQLEVKLDMPVEQLSREDLVVRDIKTLPEIKLKRFLPAHERAGRFDYLYVFFTLDNEPSKSMLPRINDFARKTDGLKVLYVYLGADMEAYKAFAGEHKLLEGDRFLYTADLTEAVKELKLPNKDGKLKPEAMPSIMLVDPDTKEILFWEEGFNRSIDQTLQQVLELVRGRKKEEPIKKSGK